MHVSRSRRRLLLSWLPAALLTVIIAGIVLTTVAVENSWWAREDPPASRQQQADDGSTMLTDAGFDYATTRAQFRLRLGEGALSAEELGMDADDERTARFRVPVRAVIAVGDGAWTLTDVTGVDAVSADGIVTAVTVTVEDIGTWTAGVARVRGLAADAGWDLAVVDGWDDALAEHYRSGADTAFTAEVSGVSAGTTVRGALSVLPGSPGASLAVTFTP